MRALSIPIFRTRSSCAEPRLVPRLAAVLCASIAGMASPGAAKAQQPTTLTVHVVAEKDSTPLESVRVVLPGTSFGGRSDRAGNVRIRGIPPGSHLVQVVRLGYQTERFLATMPAGSTLEMDVALVPGVAVLDSVRVVAKRHATVLETNGFFTRQRQGLGDFLTRDQIERMGPTVHTTELLRNTRGMHLIPRHDGLGYILVSGRTSGGSCPPALYVDGMQQDAEVVDDVLPETIEGIESYPAAEAPTQYAGDAACGVVLIWTRLTK